MKAKFERLFWWIMLCTAIFLVVLAASTNVFGHSSNFGFLGWTLIMTSAAGATSLIFQKLE